MTNTQNIELWKFQLGEEKLIKMIMYLITLGVKWEYSSFDFKKAKEDYLVFFPNISSVNPYWKDTVITYNDIPQPIKDRNRVIRIGTVREINFRKNIPTRFRIGHKYPKSFFLKDFFISIRPILTEEQDVYGLLYSNLAVNSKQYDKTKKRMESNNT